MTTTKLNRCAHPECGARLEWLTTHVYQCPACRSLYWIRVGRRPRPTEKVAVTESAARALARRVRDLTASLDAAYDRMGELYREQQQARSA